MVTNPTVERLTALIASVKIPESIQQQLFMELAGSYDKGIISIEQIINQNIIDTNPEVLSFLQRYTFDLVKNMNTDLANKLKTSLQRNLVEGKGYTQIVSEIKDTFKTTMVRARAIARTETTRAYAVGQLEAARISPVKLKKYILSMQDNRISSLCQRLSKKYPKDKAIGIEQMFKDNVTGESWISNPFHVNCRSKVIFTPVINKSI